MSKPKFQIGTMLRGKTGYYSGITGSVKTISEDTMGDFSYQIITEDGTSSAFIDESMLEELDILLEMAGRLPGRSQTRKDKRKGREHGLIIAIGNNEKDYAHFHFFRSESDKQQWNGIGGCIMMKDALYYKHSGHYDELDEEELVALIQFLKSPYKKRGVTMWQQLVDLWNDNNSRYSVPDETPMPSYYYNMPNYNEKQ